MRIVGIDPGKNGGLAYHSENGVRVQKFASRDRIFDIAHEILPKEGKMLVVIERVQMWHGDTGGKQFRIEKLLRQQQEMITTFEMLKQPVLLVSPVSWKRLFKVETENQSNPKMAYRDYAQELFPEVKCTLWNSDALLILRYGQWLWKSNPKKVMQKITRPEMFVAK